MNRYIGILLLLFGITLAQPLAARRVRIKNKQLALIAFDFTVHSTVRGKMLPYEGLFPLLPSRLSSGDPIFFRLKSYCYESFQRQAERNLRCILMPLNTFGHEWKYDEYGFPDTNIELAQRRGDAKYYLKLEMDVLASPESGLGFASGPKEKTDLRPKDYLRPEIKFKLTLYKKRGVVPYAVFESDYQWETPVLLQPTMLDGLVNTQVRNDRTTVREILDMGISAIIDEVLQGRSLKK